MPEGTNAEMKQEESATATPEDTATTAALPEPKAPVVSDKPTEPVPEMAMEEQRDDTSTNKDTAVEDNKESSSASIASSSAKTSSNTSVARDQAPPKKSNKPKKNSSSSNNNRNGGRYPPDRYPYPGRGPYPGHGMHPGGPMGPPPPHYGYGGPPPHDYRGPPPPHYHQMPPMPHQGGPYGPGPNGPYGPPPPHGMGGRHPGSGYGVPYGAPYPPMGGHHMPPYHGMSFQGGQGMPGANENNSITSNKSKSSAKSKSHSSKSGNSNGATRKKRTIDGVHDAPPHHHAHPHPHHHHHHHPHHGGPAPSGHPHNQELPNSAYNFRRTESTASSSTTVTTGNNTSLDTVDNNNSEKQQQQQQNGSMKPRDRMHHGELPPLSHPPTQQNSFDESTGRRFAHHRRDHSGASTTSSLSVGGFSLSSHEGPHRSMMSHEDAPMMKQSPKRRKGEDAKVLIVDTGNPVGRHQRTPSGSSHSIGAAEATRFGKLSMEDRDANPENGGASLFLSLSTSPINHAVDVDVDATPISKNTKKPTKSAIKVTSTHSQQPSAFMAPQLLSASRAKAEKIDAKMMDRTTDTPTPPLTSGTVESEMMTDEQSMLNRHLRIQSFTPLNHMGAPVEGTAALSPSNMGAFGSIAPQLSWSIAGDTPSLGDLAEWEEHAKDGKSDEKKRPTSTTSSCSRKMAFSPHSFNMWADDENGLRSVRSGEDSIRLSISTPHSELGMMEGTLSGTTTPLPIFFDQPSSEERENRTDQPSHSARKGSKSGDPEHIHSMFVSNGGRSSEKAHKAHMHHFWGKGEPTPGSDMGGHMGLPPTPMFAASDFGREDGFVRSPMHGGRDDFFPSGAMYGHPGSAGHDRVRSLRGRAPHGGHHLAPMPLHIPPPMSSHLPLTSPMGHGKAGMWSPHHGSMPLMGSPMHMSPMNMSQSKRKCVPLKPPIPSKFQGDIEKVKSAQVPEFTSLVNFPAHMSQKQSVNLPEGMRCCVMCGSACPCSSGNKCKKGAGPKGAKANDGSLAPRNSNGQDMMGDKNGYAIIPTQNKGLCTLCDVNVWVVVTTGLEIKWCKGCKNFRPWAAFGDKGLATKCLRCRERQREKYALQKEEKEKARLVAKAGGKN